MGLGGKERESKRGARQITMGRRFRKQIDKGHEARKGADKLWPEPECKSLYQIARDIYEVAHDCARKRKQRAEAKFYQAVCTHLLLSLASEDKTTEKYEVEFNEYENQARHFGRVVLVEMALDEAQYYAS